MSFKKKAQHEANKIKLSGLNEEHSNLFYLDIIFKFLIINFLKH